VAVSTTEKTYSPQTIVAQSLSVIHQRMGYVSPARSKDQNTNALVIAALRDPKNPPIDIAYLQLADEVIDFFRDLHKHPDYKSIKERGDAAEFESCHEAVMSEVTTLTFPIFVFMAHLYGKLRPRKPKVLNPNETQAKIINPGEFMGTLNTAERFFWKLVYVSRADASKSTMFKVLDRSGNIGFFQDRAEKFEGKIYLGDCFAAHATPVQHTAAKNGEKHTTFRSIEFIPDTIVAGKVAIDDQFDESVGKKFSKGAM